MEGYRKPVYTDPKDMRIPKGPPPITGSGCWEQKPIYIAPEERRISMAPPLKPLAGCKVETCNPGDQVPKTDKIVKTGTNWSPLIGKTIEMSKIKHEELVELLKKDNEQLKIAIETSAEALGEKGVAHLGGALSQNKNFIQILSRVEPEEESEEIQWSPKYGDHIDIVGGFYQGSKGIVIGRSDRPSGNTFYNIRIPVPYSEGDFNHEELSADKLKLQSDPKKKHQTYKRR